MSAKSKTPAKSRKDAIRAERRRKQLLSRAGLGLAVALVVAITGYFALEAILPKPGQSLPLLSRTHIKVGDTHEPYNSNPPTSGPHADPVPAGFYDQAPPDENLVHNLEHGYVIIWYNCSSLDEAGCQGLKTQIKDVMDRARPVVVTTGAKKLIAVPRQTMDALIALTSWGRLDTLSSFDVARVTEFINRLRNQSPEPAAP